MKKYIQMIAVLGFGLLLPLSHAQFGGGGMGAMGGPSKGMPMEGAMTELFGEHKAFSAVMEFSGSGQGMNGTMSMPGKMALLDGKSRFEIDLSRAKGAGMNAEMGEQMKSMGFAEIITLTRTDKKQMYIIYPGLKSYVEQPMPAGTADTTEPKTKVVTTEIGKETVEGHPCIKNKAVVTDEKGEKHEALVWNATDLKKFPVKIESSDKGQKAVLLFKDIKMEKPDAKLFELPEGYTRYESQQALMQEAMMKMMGGMGGRGR